MVAMTWIELFMEVLYLENGLEVVFAIFEALIME